MRNADTLISIVNKLQDAFSVLGSAPIALPQIAVVGGQSAGKSSVLENIVGRDFLPRGSGIVTRRPLVLKLVNSPGLAQDYGEFLHAPGKKFTDFAQICREIESATDSETGTNKGISSSPINLTVFSRTVLDLTLVDLPGLTKVAVGDQPDDIGEQIRAMLMEFISQENTIILAVTPANTDIANSDALQLAKEVDPEGYRTVGVITKLDLMDRGTDALDVLQNKVVPLRLGYVGVVNRSQHDINTKKDIQEQWKAEEAYFRQHPRYRAIADDCGTKVLSQTLNSILVQHIKKCLPDITASITKFLDEKRGELAELEALGSDAQKGQLVLNALVQFGKRFTAAIHGSGPDDGDSEDAHSEVGGGTPGTRRMSVGARGGNTELTGGAKINDLFNVVLPADMDKVDIAGKMDRREIHRIIKNSNGMHGGLFIPHRSFELAVKKVIRMLQAPAMNTLDKVFDELLSIVMHISTPAMNRFMTLQTAVHNTARDIVLEHKQSTSVLCQTLLDMELSLINIQHPQFMASRSNILQMMSEASEALEAEAQRAVQASHSTTPSAHRTPKAAAPNLHSGYLEKIAGSMLGHTRGGRRFVTIGADRVLAVSHSRESPAPADHTFPLNSSCSVAFKGDANANTFEVTGRTLSKTLTFKADNGPSAAKWMQSLSVACDDGMWEAYSQANKVYPTFHSGQSPHTPSAAAATPRRSNALVNEVKKKRRSTDGMTETERLETEVIRRLLESYFVIVRTKIQDSIPKAISLMLVDKVVQSMHSRLVETLYKPDLIDSLLQETEATKERRKRLREVTDMMEQAMESIGEVRSSIFA